MSADCPLEELVTCNSLNLVFKVIDPGRIGPVEHIVQTRSVEARQRAPVRKDCAGIKSELL